MYDTYSLHPTPTRPPHPHVQPWPPSAPHASLHAQMHAHTHTRTHAHSCTCTRISTHACTCPPAPAVLSHERMRAHMHARRRRHAYTRTRATWRAYTHTRANTHTHTLTHTCSPALLPLPLLSCQACGSATCGATSRWASWLKASNAGWALMGGCYLWATPAKSCWWVGGRGQGSFSGFRVWGV